MYSQRCKINPSITDDLTAIIRNGLKESSKLFSVSQQDSYQYSTTDSTVSQTEAPAAEKTQFPRNGVELVNILVKELEASGTYSSPVNQTRPCDKHASSWWK